MNAHDKKIGLVLTGGGARSAYQVGCLKAISEITKFEKNPFKIISGFSAGAINGTWLASRHDDFADATQRMWDAWSTITSDQVFKTSSLAFASIAFQWIKDRSLGSSNANHNQISYLLDTAPLKEFLKKNIDFKSLNKNLASRNVYGLALIAANYRTGKSTAFFSGDDQIKKWEGRNKISIRTEFTPDHIMASSAIPIFFPPVKVGQSYYGDGMVRLASPLSPAIHMGADRLLVIGVRGVSSSEESASEAKNKISVGEIAGTILNGLFFDAIDADLHRLAKIDRTLSVMTEKEIAADADHLRPIPALALRPSQNLTVSPGCELSQLPIAMRFMLKGMGITNEKGMDLLSYLAFEPKYMKSLLTLGYEDTLAKKDEILEFFK
jgi:NTE family protein